MAVWVRWWVELLARQGTNSPLRGSGSVCQSPVAEDAVRDGVDSVPGYFGRLERWALVLYMMGGRYMTGSRYSHAFRIDNRIRIESSDELTRIEMVDKHHTVGTFRL